jgi:Trk K+ transport system NAD-binding subunit
LFDERVATDKIGIFFEFANPAQIGFERRNIIAEFMPESAGLRVIQGNAADESTLAVADVESRRGLITFTPNDSINLYLARRAGELFHIRDSFVGVTRNGNVTPAQVEERGKHVLFGDPISMQQWYHRLTHRPSVAVEVWRVAPDAKSQTIAGAAEDRENGSFLLLAVERDRVIRPMSRDTRVSAGDRLYVARPPGSGDGARAKLQSRGWIFEETLPDGGERVDRRMPSHAPGPDAS